LFIFVLFMSVAYFVLRISPILLTIIKDIILDCIITNINSN